MLKITFFSLLISLFVQSCGTTQEMHSLKTSAALILDGDNSDWGNNNFYDESSDIVLHFQNDADYLYIGFATDDIVKQSQIMRMGFIIWFDKEGGDEKRIGIKFPLGFMGKMEMEKQPTMEKPGENSFGKEDIIDMVDSTSTFEIVEDGRTSGKIRRISDMKGISLNAKKYKGVYIYELKIACLKGENDISLGLKHGDNSHVVGIGFETVGFDMEKMKEKVKGNKPPGDMPPGDMPPDDGKNRMGKGKMPNMQENFKYWVKLKIVT